MCCRRLPVDVAARSSPWLWPTPRQVCGVSNRQSRQLGSRTTTHDIPTFQDMTPTNELRLFISSTFRDMQAEREHLVKKIFPEIRALCRQRGVTFTDIDLRWGITEDEAEREGIINICLDEIDRCRPWFIGILGERYGWVPASTDAEKASEQFPSLATSVPPGASITEMEIIHGVLANPAMAGHAFFYFRDRDGTPDEFIDADANAVQKLEGLKQRIRQSDFPVREGFSSPTELGEWLEADLRKAIETVFLEREVPTPLDLERRSHAAFAASRTRAYVPEALYDQRFDDWVDQRSRSGESTPLVVTGSSGLGKSSLVAHLVDVYRSNHPTAFIIEHYVGATAASGSAGAIMRHVIEEIRERFGIEDEVPSKPDELEKGFPNWLFRCERLASQNGFSVLIVLDALNQLDEQGRRLSWLPAIIPPGVMLMVSTTPGECEDRLEARGWSTLHVKPLDDETVRQSIVLRYLGEFRKGISPSQLRSLTSDQKARSPLYLRLVAEELRLHGEHETLDDIILQFTRAEDLLDVFDRVLERLERDHGEPEVRGLLTLIATARAGLSESELLDLLGASRLELSRLLFALDYHLLRRDGLLGFFHDYLRQGVERRYLPLETRRRSHKQLAEYFSGLQTTLRSTRELLYALERLDARDRLEEALVEFDRFRLLCDADPQEVRRYWSRSTSAHVAAVYRRAVDEWNGSDLDPTALADVVQEVAKLCDDVGAWSDAEELHRELVAELHRQGDSAREATALTHFGDLLRRMQKTDEAMRAIRQGEEIARRLNDRKRIARAVGGRGNIHYNRSEHAEALACYAEQEAIARELGDRSGIAGAIGNRGLVHTSRGEYDKALECHVEQVSISRELGNLQNVARGIGNQTTVFLARRAYHEALACLSEEEAIVRELGLRSLVTGNLSRRGELHRMLGEYDAALKCYLEHGTIAQELGDRAGVTSSLLSCGFVYTSLGHYDKALECLDDAARNANELRDRTQMARAFGYRGQVYRNLGDYDQALDCFAEMERISRELDDHEGIVFAIGERGTVLLDRGDFARALDCLVEHQQMCAEVGDHAGAFIAVGNQGGIHSALGEYALALQCYQQAGDYHRSIGFKDGLACWLAGIADVLVTVSALDGPMPDYLTDHLRGIDIDHADVENHWRIVTLSAAREVAEECLALSRELSKPDTAHASQMQLSRIDAAEGNRDRALERLGSLLNGTRNRAEEAEIHYLMGTLGEAEHAAMALEMYRELYEATHHHTYRTRIEELERTPGSSL